MTSRIAIHGEKRNRDFWQSAKDRCRTRSNEKETKGAVGRDKSSRKKKPVNSRDEGGKEEFTNYKMQLSAFVRGVSRSVEAVPAFEWVAKLLYRVCNLSSR